MVYEATGPGGRPVVVKVPITTKGGMVMNPSYFAMVVERLKIEAQVLKTLSASGPGNIVRYVDESTDPNDFFLVTEKVEGRTMDRVIPSAGLPEARVARMSIDVLRGLEFMHKRNTIYRDIKPSNIMVRPDGSCVIIDFGGAKQGVTHAPAEQSSESTVLESPGWSCPHQNRGRTSAECDLYAMGRVMFYMGTGMKPLSVTDGVGRITKSMKGIKSGVSDALSDLVGRMADPDHSSVHTARDVIGELGPLAHAPAAAQATARVVQRVRPIHGHYYRGGPQHGAPPRRTAMREPRIVLQGIEYRVSSMPGGSLIGKKHDPAECQRAGGGCNAPSQGRNVFVGWDCPAGCRCGANPGHVIGRHHMRVWRDGTGRMCAINNDPQRRSAINRGGRWLPMQHNRKVALRNRDQVALLYNERKGPFMEFTFYDR